MKRLLKRCHNLEIESLYRRINHYDGQELSDIEIKRGYEVLPENNIRFGIRISNISELATFAGGEGGALVKINDSVVLRTEFNGDKEK